MSALVLDTHAAVWYLTRPAKLPDHVLSMLRKSVAVGNPLFVSAISLLEVTYLVEKGKLPDSALNALAAALDSHDGAMVAVSVDVAVALAARQIAREHIPDMPDRIIAATALYLGLPLVTRDRIIQGAGIETIW